MAELKVLSKDELKQLQSKSLEMAKYVIDFCNKHDIKVFFFAGSMLGAVRNKGFIPWDDDIDIMLLAPDYNRFIKLWNDEADTDRYSLCIQTKSYNDHTLSASIRDNNTTFITDSTVDLDVNQGLAIDFDALHACPNSKIGQYLQLLCAAGSSLFKAGRVPARQSKAIKYVSKILLSIFRTEGSRYFIWNTLYRLATLPDKHFDRARYVREFSMFPFITWLYPSKWFDKTVFIPFENLKMPVPIGAKGYLQKRYNNFMELPPEEDRHPEHRIVFMDLETPYIEYRGKEYLKNDSTNLE